MQRSIFTLFFIFLMAASSLGAQATQSYCNNRFGFCLNYPAALQVSDEGPANGDGVALESANGVQVSASGSYNVMDWKPEKIFEFTQEDFADIIGLEAKAAELKTTSEGFDALLSAGTYYQYAQMVSKGDTYLIVTITGPEEALEEMKRLRSVVSITFEGPTGGR